MPQQIQFEGNTHEFPDDFSQADISKALVSLHPAETGQAKVPDQTVGHFLNRAVLGTASGLLSTAKRAMTQPETPGDIAAAAAMGPLGPLVKDVVGSHVETAKKARNAFREGRYSEAAGYAGATALPMVGPWAAGIGETIGEGDIAGGLGDLAGGLALPEVVKRLPAIPIKPRIKGSLNPVETAAVDFAERKDIPISAGAKTQNTAIKGVQALAEHQPLGAFVARRAKRATEEGLTRVSGELANEAHPAPMMPEGAAESVKGGLQARISGFSKEADTAYSKLREIESDPANLRPVGKEKQIPVKDSTGTVVADQNGVPLMRTVREQVALPVDMRNVKTALRPIEKEMFERMPPAQRLADPALNAVSRILDRPNYLSASAAEADLGYLKSILRKNVSATSKHIAREAIDELDSQVQNAVSQGGQEALKALQQGRAATKAKYVTKEVLDDLRAEPVQAFNQMLWREDTGIDMLRRVAKEVPSEMPKVGRAYIQELFDTSKQEGGFNRSQAALRSWQNLGPETKKILYPNPFLRREMDNFFNLAAKVAENPNPSGSAVIGSHVAGGALILHNPLSGGAWLLSGYGAAKLFFTPGGVRLLTQAIKIQPSRAAGALRVGQILRLVGKDAKPVELPLAATSTSPSQQTEEASLR